MRPEEDTTCNSGCQLFQLLFANLLGKVSWKALSSGPLYRIIRFQNFFFLDAITMTIKRRVTGCTFFNFNYFHSVIHKIRRFFSSLSPAHFRQMFGFLAAVTRFAERPTNIPSCSRLHFGQTFEENVIVWSLTSPINFPWFAGDKSSKCLQ